MPLTCFVGNAAQHVRLQECAARLADWLARVAISLEGFYQLNCATKSKTNAVPRERYLDVLGKRQHAPQHKSIL